MKLDAKDGRREAIGAFALATQHIPQADRVVRRRAQQTAPIAAPTGQQNTSMQYIDGEMFERGFRHLQYKIIVLIGFGKRSKI